MNFIFSLQESDGLAKKQQWSNRPKKRKPFNVSYFVKKQMSNVSKNWIRKQTCDPLPQILEFRPNLCKVWLKRLQSFWLGVVHKLRGQDEVGGWSVKCPRLST